MLTCLEINHLFKWQITYPETVIFLLLSMYFLYIFRNLCDIKQNGKLNSEQFALLMYLVQQKLQGIELPANLMPEMVPPTLRPKPASEISQVGF